MGGKMIRVPVVMQMENLECGAASLTMIMAYYGKWLPLEQVRVDCGVSRDGSNAKNIMIAARNHGLKASGFRKEIKALRKVTCPAIIHWNFNHFVVLVGFKKKTVIINDPARGRVEVPNELFDKSYTGIVLCFEPTEAFEKGGRPKRTLEFTKERLTGELNTFVFVVLTGIILAGIGIGTPLFSRIFMDFILSGKHPEWLIPLVGAMGLTLVFQFIVHAIQGIYLLRIQGKLAIEGSASFLWHVLHLPIEFFSQRFAGDIVTRQSANESIANTLIHQLAPVLLNIVLLMLYLTIMFNYNIALTLVSITAALLNLAAFRFIGKKREMMSQVMMRDAGKLSGITMSGFEMIETIKASGAENGFFQRWSGYFAKQMNMQTAFQKTSRVITILPSLLQQVANIIVLMMGVYLILDGAFTIGMLLAFQGFLMAFMAPVSDLANIGQSFIEMRSSMMRIEDVMKYQQDESYTYVANEATKNLDKIKGEINLEALTFGYSKLAAPLIENFDLSLKKGGSVALVGGSGSGKSTIAKLISGLFQPWSGRILFDHHSVKEIDHQLLTEHISVVDQDIVLFEDTIYNNVTMWDETIEKADVVMACKIAQIHDEIMNRPGGYDYVIREGGKNFSGGQRQRFEIARALVTEPSILILDEATSALDTKTEAQIIEAIKARKITLIIVAHRLSTIRDCDEIIVLDHGKVVERGSHEKLMTANGQYAHLVEN
jgi:NHLM bacteriocin system ABC transporter peptidase/ATP-binding protein